MSGGWSVRSLYPNEDPAPAHPMRGFSFQRKHLVAGPAPQRLRARPLHEHEDACLSSRKNSAAPKFDGDARLAAVIGLRGD